MLPLINSAMSMSPDLQSGTQVFIIVIPTLSILTLLSLCRFLLTSYPAPFPLQPPNHQSPGHQLRSIHKLRGVVLLVWNQDTNPWYKHQNGCLYVLFSFHPPLPDVLERHDFSSIWRDSVLRSLQYHSSSSDWTGKIKIELWLPLAKSVQWSFRRSKINPSLISLIHPPYSFLSVCPPLSPSTRLLRMSSLSLATASLRALKKPW